MKKLLVLMIAASFSLQAAPFYKVKCYNSKNKLVSCDEMARARKAASASKKRVKKDTLAQRKARERAIALREIAKQNEELKNEVQSLRMASLLAAAKTEEKPADTAVLAAPTQMVIPAATVQTVVATDKVSESTNKWGLEVANEIDKSFLPETALTNCLDIDVSYAATDHMTLMAEQEFTWNWNTTSTAKTSAFAFADILFEFVYLKMFESEDKNSTINGFIDTYIATTKATRSLGQLGNISATLRFKRAFNDGKAAIKFEPGFTWYINKSTTTNAPTVTSYDGFTDPSKYVDITSGERFEKLSPGTNYKVALKSVFEHRLMEGVTFATHIKVSSKRTFEDSALSSAGSPVILTPAGWTNSFELCLPKVTVAVSDKFTVQGWLSTSAPFTDFKLYNTEASRKGDTAIAFKMIYDI